MRKTIGTTLRSQGTAAIIGCVAALVSVFLIHRYLPKLGGSIRPNRMLSLILLLGTTVFAVGIPILLRTGYYQKSVQVKGLSAREFLKMKRSILFSVLLGELSMLIAYFIPIFTYHLYLSVLIGLYGLYSVFPTAETIRRELKTYGVDDEDLS